MAVQLSIVSPVYKAEDCVPELYLRLVAAAERITPDFELVLVEDGGPDRSWAILEEMAARDKRVKAIRLSRNFGQHYAVTAGLDHARGEWVVVMDCDLQDKPEEIEKLYHKAHEGYDMVVARRITRMDSWDKKLRSYVFLRFIAWLTGSKYVGDISNFSLVSKRAVQAFRQYRERDRTLYMIMQDVGFPLAFVDVDHGARFSGTTSYSRAKLIRLALQVMVSYSTRPLHMSIRFGAVVAAVSLLFMAFLIARYFLVNIGIAGWTSLAVLISFFFGLLFIQLGIIGLYLGKTFDECRRRPLYHIAEARNLDGGV